MDLRVSLGLRGETFHLFLAAYWALIPLPPHLTHMVLPPRSPPVEVHLRSSVGCEKVSRTTCQSSAAFSLLIFEKQILLLFGRPEWRIQKGESGHQPRNQSPLNCIWSFHGCDFFAFCWACSLFFFNLVHKGRCLIGDRWKEKFLCKLKWHLKDKNAIKLSPSGHHGCVNSSFQPFPQNERAG